MFLWARSYKISQPRRNFSRRVRPTLQQRPKKMKEYIFLKKTPRTVPADKQKATLMNPAETFWEEANFFHWKSKNDGIFFWKMNPQFVLNDT